MYRDAFRGKNVLSLASFVPLLTDCVWDSCLCAKRWRLTVVSGNYVVIITEYVCCVLCFLPIHSGHQWTYQPGSHRQEEGHTGFLIHLLSAVRALIFLARRIQPFISLVDREVEFCVLTI